MLIRRRSGYLLLGESAETSSLTDRQASETCDNVRRVLASKLNSEAARNKVDRTVADHEKSKKIDNAIDLTRRLDWSVNVHLKKKGPALMNQHLFSCLLGGEWIW